MSRRKYVEAVEMEGFKNRVTFHVSFPPFFYEIIYSIGNSKKIKDSFSFVQNSAISRTYPPFFHAFVLFQMRPKLGVSMQTHPPIQITIFSRIFVCLNVSWLSKQIS
jgi:hypothetical protein